MGQEQAPALIGGPTAIEARGFQVDLGPRHRPAFALRHRHIEGRGGRLRPRGERNEDESEERDGLRARERIPVEVHAIA